MNFRVDLEESRRNKLDKKREGPYYICKEIKNGVYILKDKNGVKLATPVHVDNLIKFYESEDEVRFNEPLKSTGRFDEFNLNDGSSNLERGNCYLINMIKFNEPSKFNFYFEIFLTLENYSRINQSHDFIHMAGFNLY